MIILTFRLHNYRNRQQNAFKRPTVSQDTSARMNNSAGSLSKPVRQMNWTELN